MFPFSSSGPVHLAAWVQVGSATYQAEIIDADGTSRITQVIRLGALVVHSVPFSALASVSLREGNYVLESFGRPSAAMLPAWVRYAEVVS
jgi:hypothetical protein